MYPLSYIWEDPLYENYASHAYEFNTELQSVAEKPIGENSQKLVDQPPVQAVLY